MLRVAFLSLAALAGGGACGGASNRDVGGGGAAGAATGGSGRSAEGGTVAQAVIGPEGGSVSSADGAVTLEVPAGALASATNITIARSATTRPDAVGPVYDIGPTGTVFAVPVTLSIHYDPSLIPAGSAESDVATDRHTKSECFSIEDCRAGAESRCAASPEHSMNGETRDRAMRGRAGSTTYGYPPIRADRVCQLLGASAAPELPWAAERVVRRDPVRSMASLDVCAVVGARASRTRGAARMERAQ